jgi:AcrR family transcriptional regulator
MAQAVGTRQAESERRRRRILDAARESFGRLGFAGATVETIASEAGVSNGLLYQFFRGKEQLFEVVLGELVRDWARAMAAGEREASAARALEVMFRSSVEFARGNPAALAHRRAARRALPPPQRDRVRPTASWWPASCAGTRRRVRADLTCGSPTSSASSRSTTRRAPTAATAPSRRPGADRRAVRFIADAVRR